MNKVKVAIALDSYKLKAWEYALLEKITNSDYASLKLIIDYSKVKVKKTKKTALYNLYEKYEKKSFKIKNNALAGKEGATLLTAIHSVESTEVEKDSAKLKEVDIIINLSSKTHNAALFSATGKDIWFLHHREADIKQAAPQGFLEVMSKHPYTGSGLMVQQSSNEAVLLYKSKGPVDSFSANLTNNINFWKSATFIPRMLKWVAENDLESYKRRLTSCRKYNLKELSNLKKSPSTASLIMPLLGYVGKLIKQKINKTFFHEQWFLLFDLKGDDKFDFGSYKKILPPKDRFWADPFAIKRDNKYYIFIEESFFPPKKKGYLSYIIMDEEGNYSEPAKIIEHSYHMSYPHIFEYEGELYMIPESNGGSTIQLYKCTEFPGKWEFQFNIMEDIEAVDTTLLQHNGKWWMFTNIRENKGASTWDELFLFYADNPLTKDWTPHPTNPIVSDVQSARPAGNLYVKNGKIYRPAQNCSYKYGYGLVINEVKVLSETAYEEGVVKSIEPDFDNVTKAVHTYNKEDKLTLIDGKLNRPKYW